MVEAVAVAVPVIEAIAEAASGSESIGETAAASIAESIAAPPAEESEVSPPEPTAELVADVSAPVDGADELVDPAPVVAETAGEELQMEAPAEPVEPLEGHLDPIQKLFLDSIREYSTKSQASGGVVDAGSDFEKTLAEEITKLQRLYGGGDLSSFPEFKFTEPKLDEVSQT
nr:uncharacterized protein LOC122769974 isoform X2 [Solea senegalensis]